MPAIRAGEVATLLPVVFWISLLGLIAVTLGAAALYDHRVRRRGGHLRNASGMAHEAFNNRLGVRSVMYKRMTEPEPQSWTAARDQQRPPGL